MLINRLYISTKNTFGHWNIFKISQSARMKQTLSVDKSKPSLYLRLVAESLKETVTFKWDSVTALKLNALTLHSPGAISRHLARSNPQAELYGKGRLEQAEVDHWIWFGLNKFGHGDFNTSIRYCNEVLSQNSYMVGNQLSLADLSVLSGLKSNNSFNVVLGKGLCGANLTRWYEFVSSIPEVEASVADMPQSARGGGATKAKDAKKTDNKEEGGKFVELPGAAMGNVVVRFPPEASGFLHIGHAKAALLNQHYSQSFNGKFIMRFDDTNPAKENAEFEKIILEDVEMLKIKGDIFSFTSNHFPIMMDYAVQMINKSLAYVDDTDPALMKDEREKRQDSVNRNNSVEVNLSKWNEMVAGSEYGKKCCLRAKIDMASDNGCLRDPTIYRCKDEVHPRTGTKFIVYPTYDFACPIVDSVEGVTHALRTTEYNDRDPQYYWFIDQLGLRRPLIWSYSRLNLTHTVLSKRKLAWFVEQGLVSGWDDPRFPTVRGVLRRGLTVEALRQFIILQGSAKSVVQMGWDKIWTINKKIIDPIAPRYTGLAKASLVPVTVAGVESSVKQCAKHPKNTDVGEKSVHFSGKVYLEGEDAENLKPGEKITMINWGNMVVEHLSRSDNKVDNVTLRPVLDDTDFKKTVKLTWLADVPENVAAVSVHYDNIISKPVLGKDEDFKSFIGHQTVFETELLGDPSLRDVKKGDIIQLQRRGYFICDSPYQSASEFTGLPLPCMLINIPDGRVQVLPTTAGKSAAPTTCASSAGNAAEILSKVQEQGINVRDLKTNKANKEEIKAAVDKLLALKKQYKDLTGSDPPPAGAAPPTKAAPVIASGGGQEILASIEKQGLVVRNLKSQKADKSSIKLAVDELLLLKKQYKDLTGSDPPPAGAAPPTKAAPVIASGGAQEILVAIDKQGLVVRNLKSQKADKSSIKLAVDELLLLKKQYKDLTGSDPPPAGAAPPTKAAPVIASGGGQEILAAIEKQGLVVRNLKSQKADKSSIKLAVDELLLLKKQYKDLTGSDPPPAGAAPPTKAAPVIASGGGQEILASIEKQGLVVRNLKSQKADKSSIKLAVDELLLLKKQYKDLTGSDPPPAGAAPPTKAAPVIASGGAQEILVAIEKQGLVVRNLKSQKADKSSIKLAVDELLLLKKQYKDKTGSDPPPAGAAPPTKAAPVIASGGGQEILAAIEKQGLVVRNLKSQKADKSSIKLAVDELLLLKKQYKDLTGSDPPPAGAAPPTKAAPVIASGGAQEILASIEKQGLVVRNLKSQKADKSSIKLAVDELLLLKKQYKDLTGSDPPPAGAAPPTKAVPVITTGKDAPPDGKAPEIKAAMPTVNSSSQSSQLEAKIKEQGDKVRAAKSKGESKDSVQDLVNELLKLKTEYKTLTGQDAPVSAPQQQSSKQKKKAQKAAAPKVEAGVTRLGLEAKKFEDLPNWYSQVITKSEMIEYYDVSGCYILRPWSFSIWETIQKWFDEKIKEMGVQNCYFPMFVSHAALEKEKTHIADFAPEVAWVTKSGDSELAEPVAIRPTSETVMYPSYSTWVQSHRDLPIKLNQWCNVVRWEFKHPQPFLRTREFLWQEGHSAFATRPEAEEEVMAILDLYHRVYKELLAIPTVKGRKTEKEKFAGGDFTTTVEGYVAATGRGIQGATSHHLGQNFSKMFDITFEDPDSESKEKIFAHQNSWGLSTRSIGVVVMVHGDDKGLVMPPRVAMYQTVIVPCGITESNKDELNAHCSALQKSLHKSGIRSHADVRMNYNTGWKFNHWELKGVPLRIEVGPRDIKNNQVVVVRRDTGVKATLPRDTLEDTISALLRTVHDDMYARALAERDANLAVTTVWGEFCTLLDQKKIIMSPYCGDISCEDMIKKDSARTEEIDDKAPAMGAKSLCIPFEQPGDATEHSCVHPKCGKAAKFYTLFGRSY